MTTYNPQVFVRAAERSLLAGTGIDHLIKSGKKYHRAWNYYGASKADIFSQAEFCLCMCMCATLAKSGDLAYTNRAAK